MRRIEIHYETVNNYETAKAIKTLKNVLIIRYIFNKQMAIKYLKKEKQIIPIYNIFNLFITCGNILI